MKPGCLYTLILTLALIASGCAANSSPATPQPGGGLEISSTNSSLGGPQAEAGITVFTYHFTLQNNGPQETLIRTAEPVLTAALSARLLTDDLSVEVGDRLAPGAWLEVSGEFTFDTKNLTKEQILEMEPYLTGFKLATEQILPLPGGNKQ